MIILLVLLFILFFIPLNSKSDNFINSKSDNFKRCLITDILFPTKYSKWRLVEIHSFINKYDTDILIINRINTFKNINFSFDYEELKDKFNLYDYNILIFNPKFNYLNKYNIDFNGIEFNNLINCDYLLRKKKFKNEKFDINNYEFVYHIFLMNYLNFNNIFKYPFNKQFIHLYPGGGSNEEILIDLEKNINKKVNIISTQQFISKYITRENKIDIFGGPFYYKNEQNKFKVTDNKELSICFTCLGDYKLKGGDHYINIVNIYKNRYPSDLVNFYSIGPSQNINNIICLPQMNQDTLDNFYYNNIDIVINLTTSESFDGFPLGVESIINGCLLLTTDTFGMNDKNNFNFNNFIIIDTNKIENIITKIKILYDDKKLLNKLTKELQYKIYELFNYNNSIVKTFNFIDNCLTL